MLNEHHAATSKTARLTMQRMIALGLLSLVVACGNGDGPAAHASREPATSGADTHEPEAQAPTIVVGTDVCATDADCIPGSCCHPTTCVGRSNPPTCVESVCTSDCRYGTLDCGGSCLCHQGHCAAQLSALPTIPGVPQVQ
jgi:hypothetical protein